MVTSSTDVRALLVRGEITLKGRLPRSSNATFLAEVSRGEARALAVYKPERGERPLWDFPPGLFKRELAAYHLSETLGWGLVPLTIRRDGPYGDGSLQAFVHADFAQHYFTLYEDAAHHARLRRRSEEHTSELQSQSNLVCRLLLEKKKTSKKTKTNASTSTTAR